MATPSIVIFFVRKHWNSPKYTKWKNGLIFERWPLKKGKKTHTHTRSSWLHIDRVLQVIRQQSWLPVWERWYVMYRNASQTVSNSAHNRCSLLTSNGQEWTSAVGKLQSRCHKVWPATGSRIEAIVRSEPGPWFLQPSSGGVILVVL